jgi:hypothetical protein
LFLTQDNKKKKGISLPHEVEVSQRLDIRELCRERLVLGCDPFFFFFAHFASAGTNP